LVSCFLHFFLSQGFRLCVRQVELEWKYPNVFRGREYENINGWLRIESLVGSRDIGNGTSDFLQVTTFFSSGRTQLIKEGPAPCKLLNKFYK
jgi:hypothetical protein